MTLPTSLEPFLEPEAMWSTDMPPSARTAGDLLTAAISMLVLVVVIWEDVARNGPWASAVTGPLELASAPLSLSAGWLLAGGALALSAGAILGRRRRAAAAGRVSEPLVPRLPVFLRFDGRRVVVVGGGAVAASKIPALLEAGADVTVVAPDISPAIDRTRLRVCERPFEPSDLDGAWFVTAAATPAVNRQVRDAAEARAVFVNAVDDSANATAYLGGTIARGDVTVAFSTAGKAPALAGLLREGFDALLPADLEAWVSQAHELSRRQRAEGVPMSERRPLLLQALNRLYGSTETARVEGGVHS